jgi:hypothetical protein
MPGETEKNLIGLLVSWQDSWIQSKSPDHYTVQKNIRGQTEVPILYPRYGCFFLPVSQYTVTKTLKKEHQIKKWKIKLMRMGIQIGTSKSYQNTCTSI